jgi:hypothetical protein
VGPLLGGALDGQLSEAAAAGTGRLVDIELSQVDALVAGLPQGGVVSCLVMAAADLPAPLWDQLVARNPITLVADLDGTASRGPSSPHRAATATAPAATVRTASRSLRS